MQNPLRRSPLMQRPLRQSCCRPVWITAIRQALPLLLVGVVILLMTLLMTNDVLACPTCKDGLAESDPASQAQARGFFYSILFMMAMPFVILGTLGSAAYLSIQRAREDL